MDFILALLGLVSIPSIITGIITARLNKKLDDRDKAREKEAYLQLKYIKAIGGVVEKVAICVKNERVNGDMTAALDYEKETKHELENFLDEQAMRINH